MSEVIQDLDVKLNNVLQKQEYEYLKGYNIYVKRKEKELRDLIHKLTLKEKSSNAFNKEKKIASLEHTIRCMRDDALNAQNV